MKSLPLLTALLSAVAAVSLWLIASWVENGVPWSVPPPPVSPAQQSANPQSTSGIDVAACDEAEAEMRELVQQSRSCTEDAQCAIFDYGYPIECLTSVARAEISNLRIQFRRYHQSCEYRVYYDCPTGEMRRQPVCRDNQCAVDLIGMDSLKDQTLDHLGLE